MASAMKCSQIDVSKISFSNPKKLDNGGQMLWMNYNNGMMYMQTPELEIPFDTSFYSDNDHTGKYQVKVSMKGMDDNKSLRDFHDKVLEMDNHIKAYALQNSGLWFKKPKMSEETVDSLYTPMIRVSTDPETGEPNGKYPPQFAFKVVKKNNKVECSVYDNNKVYFDVNGETDNPTDIARILSKGSKVKVVLKCNGIWLANGKFGCTWKAEQIRVKVSEAELTEFAIVSDSEDEADENDVMDQPPTNLIEDSDESEEEVEKTPEPPPEPKKKTRKVKVKSSN